MGVKQAQLPAWVHDPNAVLDYTVDWTDWLADGETITDHEVVVTSGNVVIGTTGVIGGLVHAWISGGTKGTQSAVRYRITTSALRTDDRTIILSVRER